MSLILEALRKSEAERRRAQVPDLLTEAQAATPVVAHAAPRWPMWIGSAVVAVAAVWFVMSRDVDPPAQDATVADTATEATPPATDDVASRDPAPARPAPALQRPLVVAAPKPAAEIPATTNPQPATGTPPQPVASTPAALPAPPPRAEPVPVPVAPAAPVASPAPAIERLNDLGSADRKQLPPLKLSMHMWNDVVAQRVVVIDGTRLGVGDRLGAVVIADIVPDGVLLDWNGRALKLPLR